MDDWQRNGIYETSRLSNAVSATYRENRPFQAFIRLYSGHDEMHHISIGWQPLHNNKPDFCTSNSLAESTYNAESLHQTISKLLLACESESANKQKENLFMEPVMLTHTLEELINDANSSTDEGTPSYSGDNYRLKVSEALPSDSENNNDEFQIYQSNGDCATGHILCSSDEIALLSQIYNNMAIFCIANDQLKNAEHYLKVAAECMPDNIDVLYNFCLLELKNGNFDVAQNMWENGKQKISIINSVLTGETSTFPHSVTFEQIETLNDIFNVENNISFTFDVDWSD